MIRFRKPTKIQLNDGRLLFLATHSGARLILVATHYFDNPIDWKKVTVSLQEPRRAPLSVEIQIRREYEPCVVCRADVPNEPIVLKITYGDESWRVSLEHEMESESTLYAMTLFQGDYGLLATFIDHYVALGVEEFHLYYNGKLSDVNWEPFLHLDANHKNIRVQIVEWDVSYWWKFKGPVSYPIYAQQGFQHHAQPMAVNHCMSEIRREGVYAFFVDLDEYIFTPKAVLRLLIANGVSAVIFYCWWATSPSATFRGFDFLSYANGSKELRIAAAHCEWGDKTKCLIKVSDVALMGIHIPLRYYRNNFVKMDGFFHFRGFTEAAAKTDCPETPDLVHVPEFVRALFPTSCSESGVSRER